MKLLPLLLTVFAALAGSAHAVLLDFGTSWPGVFTGVGAAPYNTAPYNRVIGAVPGQHANETAVAAALNSALPGDPFDAGDILKFGAPAELGGSDGQFGVQPGYDWLVIQYDGPNGGSVIIRLGGNSALVPYDSADLWGSGDQYAVSHYSLVNLHEGPPDGDDPGTPVPDNGPTVALMGLSLLTLGLIKRKTA